LSTENRPRANTAYTSMRARKTESPLKQIGITIEPLGDQKLDESPEVVVPLVKKITLGLGRKVIEAQKQIEIPEKLSRESSVKSLVSTAS